MSSATDLAEARKLGLDTKEIVAMAAASSNIEAARITGKAEVEAETARNETATAPTAAPTSVVATQLAGHQASVAFTGVAAGSNGGQPITSYEVTSSPGSIVASGPASPVVVTGLTIGQAYTFTVKAVNEVGKSAASAASASTTAIT